MMTQAMARPASGVRAQSQPSSQSDCAVQHLGAPGASGSSPQPAPKTTNMINPNAAVLSIASPP